MRCMQEYFRARGESVHGPEYMASTDCMAAACAGHPGRHYWKILRTAAAAARTGACSHAAQGSSCSSRSLFAPLPKPCHLVPVQLPAQSGHASLLHAAAGPVQHCTLYLAGPAFAAAAGPQGTFQATGQPDARQASLYMPPPRLESCTCSYAHMSPAMLQTQGCRCACPHPCWQRAHATARGAGRLCVPRTGVERNVQRKAARLSLDTTAHASTAYQEFVRQLAPMAASPGCSCCWPGCGAWRGEGQPLAGRPAGCGLPACDQRLQCRGGLISQRRLIDHLSACHRRRPCFSAPRPCFQSQPAC